MIVGMAAGSWDFGDVSDAIVDVMTCSELSTYLTTDLKFPVEDIQELESKLIRIVHTQTLRRTSRVEGPLGLCNFGSEWGPLFS